MRAPSARGRADAARERAREHARASTVKGERECGRHAAGVHRCNALGVLVRARPSPRWQRPAPAHGTRASPVAVRTRRARCSSQAAVTKLVEGLVIKDSEAAAATLRVFAVGRRKIEDVEWRVRRARPSLAPPPVCRVASPNQRIHESDTMRCAAAQAEPEQVGAARARIIARELLKDPERSERAEIRLRAASS